jgi:hypothetical protein
VTTYEFHSLVTNNGAAQGLNVHTDACKVKPLGDNIIVRRRDMISGDGITALLLGFRRGSSV